MSSHEGIIFMAMITVTYPVTLQSFLFLIAIDGFTDGFGINMTFYPAWAISGHIPADLATQHGTDNRSGCLAMTLTDLMPGNTSKYTTNNRPENKILSGFFADA